MSCCPSSKIWLPSMGAVILSHSTPLLAIVQANPFLALSKGFAIAVRESNMEQEDATLSRLLGTRFTQTLPQSGFHISCGKLPGLVDPHTCHPRKQLDYHLVGLPWHYYGP